MQTWQYSTSAQTIFTEKKWLVRMVKLTCQKYSKAKDDEKGMGFLNTAKVSLITINDISKLNMFKVTRCSGRLKRIRPYHVNLASATLTLSIACV